MKTSGKLTAVQKATDQMTRLDAAGYGIIMVRCNRQSDIRRMISGYVFGSNFRETQYPCSDSPSRYQTEEYDNILEATSLGTVRRFGEAFQWTMHGYDQYGKTPYGEGHALSMVLSKCLAVNTRMNHCLIYIPEVSILEDTDNGNQEIRQQYLMMLKELALRKREGKTNALVVIGCTDGRLCSKLKDDSYILDIPYPETWEVVQIIRRVCAECEGGAMSLMDDRVLALAELMRGFREEDIRRIFYQAFATDELPTAGKASVLFEAAKDAKKQMIAGVAGLKWENAEGEIGGMATLICWLKKQEQVYHHPWAAKLHDVVPAKGILLFGFPGCGKSLMAKIIAQRLGDGASPLPLLKMDMTQFKGSYLGETEANCEQALKVVESVAPCVLQIDEVEKVFGSVGSEGAHETTTHQFSRILQWMETPREKPIFIIATANQTEKLPPEFMRKGRFDELFFVGVPCAQDCREIFRVHLNKKKHLVQTKDWEVQREEIITEALQTAAKLARFFNGADIETMVQACFSELFSNALEGKDEKTLSSIDSAEDPFLFYSPEEVKKVLVHVVETTRSYFDNNMQRTVYYWLNMYDKQFLEAGGNPPQCKGVWGENRVILPMEQGCFDPKRGMFRPRHLKDQGLLSDPERLPPESKGMIEKADYQAWLDHQLTCALGSKTEGRPDYDGAFRWTLAREIFRCTVET